MHRKSSTPLLIKVLVVLIPMLALSSASWAQTKYRVLHSFTGGADGGTPFSPLIIDSAGNLYGTTLAGGTSNAGTVFELSPGPPGSWTEKVLYNFKGGRDGANPYGGVIFDSQGNLYGTTTGGGYRSGYGTAFELMRQPTGEWTEKILHAFNSYRGDGFYPEAGLVFDEQGNLYGTTQSGGANSPAGAVFELAPRADGTWSESLIHSFDDNGGPAYPTDQLIIDEVGNLYGTTSYKGSVFELSPGSSGWTFSVLATVGITYMGVTAHDGALYAASEAAALVFQLERSGDVWNETVLYGFPSGEGPEFGHLTFDASGSLYGTTSSGGTGPCKDAGTLIGCGTVYQLTPSGSTWIPTVVYNMPGGPGGEYPVAGVILDKRGNLYGTASHGGGNGCINQNQFGCGVVFGIEP